MNRPLSELLPNVREALENITRRKSPLLVTHNGQPAAYERLQKRMRILEGIARGEKAIREGRTLSHTEAKTRMKRWLD